jgi:AcrR family transcriptional regulator
VTATTSSRIGEIREAALVLFTRLGYEATTMADIGAEVGIRGPSLYKHVASKQDLLVSIMIGTMDALLAAFASAVSTTTDPVERLRRATDAHVRYHCRHRLQAFVGNREIRSLLEPHRSAVIARRDQYERGFRRLVVDGVEAGVFSVASPRLASYAILDLGMGVANWYRSDGEHGENEVAWQYTEFALRMVAARVALQRPS